MSNQPVATQPPRRPRHPLAGAIVVLVLVVLVALVALFATGALSLSNSGSKPQDTITAVDLGIVYQGSTSGYFGPVSNSYCPDSDPLQQCSVVVATGSVWVYNLNLVSTASLFTHRVTSITIQSPFTEESFTPGVPQSVSPGGSVLFTIDILTPSTAGSYAVSITVTTS